MFLLIRLIPQIAELPTPAQWRQSREDLNLEISARKQADAKNAVLAAIVAFRMTQLSAKRRKA